MGAAGVSFGGDARRFGRAGRSERQRKKVMMLKVIAGVFETDGGESCGQWTIAPLIESRRD